MQSLRVIDDMKSGTPVILYDLWLVQDELYSESIDGLPGTYKSELECLVHGTVEYYGEFPEQKGVCQCLTC